MTILILFMLLIMISVPAMASGAGNVTVLDKNGNDITKDNVNAGNDTKGEEGGNNESITSDDSTQEDDEGVLKILQTAGENALNGFTASIIDALIEGSVNIYATDVGTEMDGSVTYDIRVKELHPFEHPLVVPIQLITFCFLILVTIITILGSMILTGFQAKHPETYGEWKRSMSGEYKPYNPNRVHAACVWSITRPVLYLVGYVAYVIGRNYIISSAPQTATGILIPSTDNIAIWGLTGISMFVGSFQTTMGEYGVYLFGILLYVICMITDVFMIFNMPEVSKQIENVAWGAFGLFCICDIINMGCTSFGVITSQWLGDTIYITDGIVAGAFINGILLAVLTIYAVFKIKKASGV